MGSSSQDPRGETGKSDGWMDGWFSAVLQGALLFTEQNATHNTTILLTLLYTVTPSFKEKNTEILLIYLKLSWSEIQPALLSSYWSTKVITLDFFDTTIKLSI